MRDRLKNTLYEKNIPRFDMNWQARHKKLVKYGIKLPIVFLTLKFLLALDSEKRGLLIKEASSRSPDTVFSLSL